MKNLTLARFASAALCIAMASDAAAETGGGASAADAPKPGDAVPVTDAMKAEEAANAAAAKGTADLAAAEKSAGAGADEKSSYRVKSDFHDTTTGRLRKAGRVLKATDKRAAQLAAARVIETDADGKALPIEDEDEDEDDGEESVFTRQEDFSQATRDAVEGKVAPVGLDGPVDEAVAREVAEQGLATTDGGASTMKTSAVPAVITGNKPGRAKAK